MSEMHINESSGVVFARPVRGRRRTAAILSATAIFSATARAGTLTATYTPVTSVPTVDTTAGQFLDWVIPTGNASAYNLSGERLTLSDQLGVWVMYGNASSPYTFNGYAFWSFNQGTPTYSGTSQLWGNVQATAQGGGYYAAGYTISAPVPANSSGTLTIYAGPYEEGLLPYNVYVSGDNLSASGSTSNSADDAGYFSIAYSAIKAGTLSFSITEAAMGPDINLSFDGATLTENGPKRLLPVGSNFSFGETITPASSGYYVISNTNSLVYNLSPAGGPSTVSANLSSFSCSFDSAIPNPNNGSYPYYALLAFGHSWGDRRN
jgi:hypothetical protein